MSRFKKSKNGFTLTELVITVAIVAILGGIAIPIFLNQKSGGERTAISQEISQINQLASYMLGDSQLQSQTLNPGETLSYDGRYVSITNPTIIRVATDRTSYCVVVNKAVDGIYFGIDSDMGQREGSSMNSVCPES